MECSTLPWSKEDMSLRQFVERYRNSLPVFVLTTSGFMDDDNINEVSSGQIYWVYDVFDQRRVIATTEDMRYVSIPLNSTFKFHKLTRRNEDPGPAMWLEQIINDKTPSNQRIMLAAGRSVLFDLSTGGISKRNVKLDVLELEDIYTEKYLLAYPINEDEWVSQVTGLPVYLPVRVKVANGIGKSVEQKLSLVRASGDHQEFMPCKEIMMFQEPPSGNYEYINAFKYAQSCDDNSDDGYEYLPDSQSAPSQSASSLHRLYSQRTEPEAARIPAKKWQEQVSTKPHPEPVNRSSSVTGTPADAQSKQTGDGLLYEDISSFQFLNLEEKCGPTKPDQASSQFLKTSGLQHREDRQYAEPVKKPAPATKPKPKPKTFIRNQSVTTPSAGTDNGSTVAVCRVTPVKPPVGSDTSCSTQSCSTRGGKKYWKSARDVPADMRYFTVNQVGECMELLHLPKLAAAFMSQDVDGKLLNSIVDEKVLMTDFNCSMFEAKKIVQFVKNGWRPNE